jgi:hypothetical protein
MQRGLLPSQTLIITSVSDAVPPRDEKASESETTPDVRYLHLTIDSLRTNLSRHRNLIILLQQNINTFIENQLALPDLEQLQKDNTEFQSQFDSLLADKKGSPLNPQLLKKQNAYLKGRLGMVAEQYRIATITHENILRLNAQLNQQNDELRKSLAALADEKLHNFNILEAKKQNEALQVALSNSKNESESKTAEWQHLILAQKSKIRELQMELDQFSVERSSKPNANPVDTRVFLTSIPLQQNLERTNTSSPYNFFSTGEGDLSISPGPDNIQIQYRDLT